MTAARMIPLDEAVAIVRARLPHASQPVETVALAHASGRVLADELTAPRDVPGFRHSAMDGYAVDASDLSTSEPVELEIVGTLLAGGAEIPAWRPGGAVRIMTGAPMPEGTDTVVIRENTTAEGDRVRIVPGTLPGANVRGADDDYAEHDLALPAGTRIGAADIGIAAAFGYASLPVRVKPRVAVLVTGDELAAPGDALRYGQRYESNGSMLAALATAEGARVVGVETVRDDPREIAARLAAWSREVDLVVTSGGVSAGDADHVPRVIERDGRIHFWKVRMRPGMPALFGETGHGTPVFALPGNPVSVFATFTLLVKPAIERLLGVPERDHRWYAKLAHPVSNRHDRLELRRARLITQRDGSLAVELHDKTSSGALRSVVESDALAELAAEPRDYAAGDVVPVHCLR